jgi:hypothetical protein
MDRIAVYEDGWQAGITVRDGDPLLSEPVDAEVEDVIEILIALDWPSDEDDIEVVDDGVFLISIPAALGNRIRKDGGMEMQLQLGDKRFYIHIEMP